MLERADLIASSPVDRVADGLVARPFGVAAALATVAVSVRLPDAYAALLPRRPGQTPVARANPAAPARSTADLTAPNTAP